MKNKLFSIVAITLLLACQDKETVSPSTSSIGLVGIWNTDSVNVKNYEDNVLKSDSTYYSPFIGKVDIIELLKFSTDSVYVKNINDSYVNIGKYNVSNNYLIVNDSGASDTLLRIDLLTSSLLNFSFTEYEESQQGQPVRKETFSYKCTIRK